MYNMETKNLNDLLNRTENLTKESDVKCIVLLKAAGNAPILSNNKIKISGSIKVANLYEYLRRNLKSVLNPDDSLVI